MHSHSLQAHKNITPIRITEQISEIIAALRSMDRQIKRRSYTAYEVADWLNVRVCQIAGRFTPMVNAGILKTDGKRTYYIHNRPYYRTLYALVKPDLEQAPACICENTSHKN